MKRLCFEVIAKAKAQPRPKKGRYGNFYNPNTADIWKANVMASIFQHLKNKKYFYNKPLSVEIIFFFKNSKRIKEYHAIKPDIDNLAKSTIDAIKDSGLIKDDCQIFELRLKKMYADKDYCIITITSFEDGINA